MRTPIINNVTLSREPLTPNFINVNIDRSFLGDANPDYDKYYLQKHVIDKSNPIEMSGLQEAVETQVALMMMEETNFMSVVFHMGGGDIGDPEYIDISDIINLGKSVIVDNTAVRDKLYVYRILSHLYEGSNTYSEFESNYVYGLDFVDIEDGSATDPITGEKLPIIFDDDDNLFLNLGDILIESMPPELFELLGGSPEEVARRLKIYVGKDKKWPLHYSNFRHRGPLGNYKHNRSVMQAGQNLTIIKGIYDANENALTNLSELIVSSQAGGVTDGV